MKALIQFDDGSRCLWGFDVARVGDSMLRVGSRLFKSNGPHWYEVAWNGKTQRWRKGGTAKVVEIRDEP